jgi:hypothetical protein
MTNYSWYERRKFTLVQGLCGNLLSVGYLHAKRRRTLKRQGGFALVELLTVVAILIILIGVVAMSVPELDQLVATLQLMAGLGL